MKDAIINGWTFWLLATLCAALALGFNVGIGVFDDDKAGGPVELLEVRGPRADEMKEAA